MANCSIFEEDLILYETPTGRKWGLVLESAEYASSDEDDDEDSDLWENVQKGSVRVAWHPGGQEEIVQEKKLTLADRSLMPGDIVRRLIEGQDSQRGFVRSSQVFCHVQLLDTRNKVLCNVDSIRLQPQEYWDTEPGDVSLDSWVGKITNVTEMIVLRFSDGAMCKVPEGDFYTILSSFEDIHEKRNPDSEFCVAGFYRGQMLRGELGDLKKAEWLNTTKQYCPQTVDKHTFKKVTVTVHEVQTEEIDVHWLCRGYAKLDSNKKVEPPPNKLTKEHIKRLKKLDCNEASSVQVGDKSFITLSESDVVETYPTSPKQSLLHHIYLKTHPLPAKTKKEDAPNKEEPKEEAAKNGVATEDNDKDNDKAVQTVEEAKNDDEDDDLSDSCSTASSTCSNSSAKKKKVPLQAKLMKTSKLKRPRKKKSKANTAREYKAGDCVPVEVIYTLTYIEVVWQDGTVEKGIPSTELFPIHHLDELEFFPGDFVLPSNTDNLPDDCYGVVQKVDHAGRTCVVKWLKPYHVGKAVRPAEIRTEEMSVYDVKDHMEYKFRPGLVVVRIGGYDNDVAPKDTEATPEEGGEQPPQQQQEQHDPSLEATGQVHDLATDGSVIIRWASGCLATCYPQDLYILGDELSELGDSEYDSDSDSDSESDSDSDASWETEKEEEVGDSEGTASNSDASVELLPDEIESISMCIAKGQSSLAGLSQSIAQPPEDIRPLALPIYKELIVLYRQCKKIDRDMSTSFMEDNTQLKDVIAEVRKEMMVEKSAKIASKVLHMFHENTGEENGATASNGETVETNSDGDKPKAESSSLQEAEETLQEKLLPPEKTKELCQKAIKVLKEQLDRSHKVFMNKYQQRLMELAPKTDDIDVVAEGESSEETKTTEASKEGIKEAKEKLTLDISDPAVEEIEAMLAKTPGTPQTPAEIRSKIEVNLNGFTMVERVPECHRYVRADHQPNDHRLFFSALKKELKLLQSSLPKGIFVKGFEDRMDVFTGMVEGPAHTPYEDALFFFDIQLPADFPKAPPLFHYLSYCSERLNPNLYEDGKVCVSLLGTWTGKGTEVWSSGKSSLLQVLISIQGLILVPEPYYNEAGYEKQRGSQPAAENSRMYNEMALVKVVQAMAKMAQNPPLLFTDEVHAHMKAKGKRFLERMEHWLNLSPAATPTTETSTSESSANPTTSSSQASVSQVNVSQPNVSQTPDETSEVAATKETEEHDSSMDINFTKDVSGPQFPLLPVSKGFRISCSKYLAHFRATLDRLGYLAEESS